MKALHANNGFSSFPKMALHANNGIPENRMKALHANNGNKPHPDGNTKPKKWAAFII
jgi:hypothetical protein